MTVEPGAEPRLLALRVHGFKSFAERTTVEFGPGISAVVGPNGSGKSNLADALRWALGEQGRALRSRKSEDVIWAGSEKRAAQGMADVTLVLDNADGLLPVDFGVLELGRRLYRSGENDYLLNKSRIRLRDLVDLLDAAHLADNAFLFIGQGMVDQALALRPEERRPLFEEVAGVRRHERRRRKAETQLAESESNLARVEDILGELRPQARRLAAQAEQQTSRELTAEELISGLFSTLHARWHDASRRLEDAVGRRDETARHVDREMQAVLAAEAALASLAAELADRSETERAVRTAYETSRASATATRLRDARLASDLDAVGRDRARLADEAAAAEAQRALAGRALAVPTPPRDVALEGALGAAERELAEALAELEALRSSQRAQGEQMAALRRAAAVDAAEREVARRQLIEAEQRATEASVEAKAADLRRTDLEAEATTASLALETVIAAERAAIAQRQVAVEAADRAEAERVAAQQRSSAATATVTAVRTRLDLLDARLADEERRGIARAARRLGGRRLDEDLVIDPALRGAVEAALAETTRAYLVNAADVAALADERGVLVIREQTGRPNIPDDARTGRFRERVEAAGGGPLDTAIRGDGIGVVRRLLARAAWLPDLADCLAIQADLPPGWVVIPRDGSAVVTEFAVLIGAGESVLERRSEAARLRAEVEGHEVDLQRLQAEEEQLSTRAREAAQAVAAGRAAENEATGQRRAAEAAERQVARRLEAAVREAAWHAAQTERLQTELERARQVAPADPPASRDDPSVGPEDAAAQAVWERRATELRERRDRLASDATRLGLVRREAEDRRASAQASIRLAEERIDRAETDVARLQDRERALLAERDGLQVELAAIEATEAAGRQRLSELEAAGLADRQRTNDAEHEAIAARERLRTVDARHRQADHDAIEARLGLDALHETMVAELAGLGDLAVTRLRRLVGLDAGTGDDGVDDAVAALEAAVAGASSAWALEPPVDPAPSAARLAHLRRRFHELGAVNPYAVAEYAAVKERLDLLETQAHDLTTAIARTRQLIVDLDVMIADRFRTTFEALELAFARRFEQLFGGGFARLSLTDPADLGATGIEIVARPPGKKAQALAMLSGGERALTAVALLFAMLEVRPVPFCVLDEVDAALDEANIGRFADALRGLADRTQFIVITHNRGTIEAADALYGVTVGDDSVSRVISLRLDEAQAIAARDAGQVVAAPAAG